MMKTNPNAVSTSQLQPLNFGDYEIRVIGFDHPNVTIKFFDPGDEVYLVATFSDVGYFLFESDHVQNVVDQFLLFESFADASVHAGFMAWLSSRGYSLDTARQLVGNRRVCYVAPTTGGEAMITYQGFSLE